MRNLLALLFIVVIFLASACSENGGSSGSGNVNVVLRSSALRSDETGRAGSSCSVTYESTTTVGLCYSPVAVSGYFSQANLSSTSGGTPVRIIGGGTTTGFANVFLKSAFDLASPPTISGSDDNIQDGGGSYNMASLTIHGLEYKFVADSGNQYYTIRIPFAATAPSTGSVYSGCGLSSGELSQIDSYGTLWSGITARQGDILVCIKSSSSATCSAGDFNWIDSSGALSASRPGTAKQLTGSRLINADSCSYSGSRPDITWGNATMDVSLASAVSVSAAFSGGKKTYTTSAGSGEKLTINLNISTTNSLFVPSSSIAGDLNSVSQATVLQNMQNILPKAIYVNNNKSSAASTGDGMFSASATLTLE